MKKYRPMKAGFWVIYALGLLCVGDAAFSLISQMRGTANEYMQSFSMFSYLIAALAVCFVRMYAQARIEIGETHMRVVWPVYIRPRQGEKRAMIIYRQGDLDMKLMNKRFDLRELDRFGYIEDLGYERLDASGVGEKNKLFPIREVALVLKDGKRYHMNAAYYKPEVVKEMVQKIHQISGVEPTGDLAKYLK
jgi:hypothetical protein